MNSNRLVFVYGTLKKGRGNHSVISDGIFKGEATTVSAYNMYYDSIPYLTKLGTASKIEGELYEVTDTHLKGPLDSLEGHPQFYTRELTDVVHNGKVISAWVYFYNHSNIQNLKLSHDGKF